MTILRDPSPADVSDLRARMDAFYARPAEYQAFSSAATDQSGWHQRVVRRLRPLIEARGNVRVLEVGCGRSTFVAALGDVRDRVTFHAQDVTEANREHMSAWCDRFFVGDIGGIDGPYDLVFHTFVFEHVASPRRFLEDVDRLLTPGGEHVIFCPRYDVPGYVPPSLRHRPKPSAHVATLRVLARRVGRRPAFLVNDDPAMFHRPWFRDADAIHLVSRADVVGWHRAKGYETQDLMAEAPLLQRRLTLGLSCAKPRGSSR